MKPPVDRRGKEDRRGKDLTPGERFKNWASGLVQLWPIILFLIGGTGYLNADAISSKFQTDNTPTNQEADAIKPAPETIPKTCPDVDLTPILDAVKSINCDLPENHSKLHE